MCRNKRQRNIDSRKTGFAVALRPVSFSIWDQDRSRRLGRCSWWYRLNLFLPSLWHVGIFLRLKQLGFLDLAPIHHRLFVPK